MRAFKAINLVITDRTPEFPDQTFQMVTSHMHFKLETVFKKNKNEIVLHFAQ